MQIKPGIRILGLCIQNELCKLDFGELISKSEKRCTLNCLQSVLAS